mmetsp:Transcript_116101/g.300981  ORF Transcript_116101/g.300981 Transcript_116101/m.300981 type:complete len:487 (-) Transcript_116101:29-1489(-)
MYSSTWVVIGGADRGGIIVRSGAELSSEQAPGRLAYGALLKEVQLVGDRLQFSKLAGDGPDEGWISTRLKSKVLAVRAMPDDLDSGRRIEDSAVHRPAMTFFAISDVHVERRENMKWLESLPKFDRSTLLVAGDLGVSLRQVEQALRGFKAKFDHVFYCYGNHETWARPQNKEDQMAYSYQDSFEKLVALKKLCQDLGVVTTPALIEGVWVVPVLGWYHFDWDNEPDLQPPPGKKLDREPIPAESLATDTGACLWGNLKNGTLELASKLDLQNEEWGGWPLPASLQENLRNPRGQRKQPVITFSHFLPRVQLMPEKRFLFQPNLSKIVGSDFIRRRIDGLQPDVHVFGHSHFPWDMTLDDGVRYRSWPLGTPEEQARRIASLPQEVTEQWHPQAIFDSDSQHYRSSESCWFSLMYTRIQREPESCHLADYVAYAYSPHAPRVPDSIISPAGFLEVHSEDERTRREKYSGKSQRSMNREMRRTNNPE